MNNATLFITLFALFRCVTEMPGKTKVTEQAQHDAHGLWEYYSDYSPIAVYYQILLLAIIKGQEISLKQFHDDF